MLTFLEKRSEEFLRNLQFTKFDFLGSLEIFQEFLTDSFLFIEKNFHYNAKTSLLKIVWDPEWLKIVIFRWYRTFRWYGMKKMKLLFRRHHCGYIKVFDRTSSVLSRALNFSNSKVCELRYIEYLVTSGSKRVTTK